jgi:hypothetical protein
MSQEAGGIVPSGIKIKPDAATAATDPPRKGASPSESWDTGKLPAQGNPLARFSLAGEGNSLEEAAIKLTPLLGNLSLSGELSVWYAPPNTGKTLILLHLAIEAVQADRIQPSSVFYVNVDDSTSGVATKVQVLDDFGIHALATGHKGFRPNALIPAMKAMAKDGTAHGTLIILDTLKKFADLMSKAECRDFGNLAREFSMAGGSLVALAHTNKKRGADQKLIYAGTADIVEDFDSAYVLDVVPHPDATNERLVRFECVKSRGDTAPEAFYSYSIQEGLSYAERLSTVRQRDPTYGVKEDEIRDVDGNVIIAEIRAAIAAGTTTKMKIVAVVTKATKASKRKVLKLLEQFTSDDPRTGVWGYERRARGAHVFFLHMPEVPVADT